MAKVMNYNQKSLEFLNNLAIINNQFIFEKSGNNVIVKRANVSKTIAYIYTLPKEHFDFDGENIAFYNFPEFYQLFSTMANGTAPILMEQNENKLILSATNSKINYLLSDIESIQKGPGNVNFSDEDLTLKLSNKDMTELKKMISLLVAENVKFSIKDKVVTVKIFNSIHDNSFEIKYTLEESSKVDFDITISSEVFTVIPIEDYSVKIKHEGIIKFELNKNSEKLELYTAEVED